MFSQKSIVRSFPKKKQIVQKRKNHQCNKKHLSKQNIYETESCIYLN